MVEKQLAELEGKAMSDKEAVMPREDNAVPKEERAPEPKACSYLMSPAKLHNKYRGGNVALFKALVVISCVGLIAVIIITMTDFRDDLGMAVVGVSGMVFAVLGVASMVMLQQAKNAQFVETVDVSKADRLSLDEIMQLTNHKSKEHMTWFLEDAIRGGYLPKWNGVVQGGCLVGLQRAETVVEDFTGIEYKPKK